MDRGSELFPALPTSWVVGVRGAQISLRLCVFTCKVRRTTAPATVLGQFWDVWHWKCLFGVWPGMCKGLGVGAAEGRVSLPRAGPRVPGWAGSRGLCQLGSHPPLCALAPSLVKWGHRGSHVTGFWEEGFDDSSLPGDQPSTLITVTPFQTPAVAAAIVLVMGRGWDGGIFKLFTLERTK